MFKNSFDRSPLVIILRLILLALVLAPLGFGIYKVQGLHLGNRTPPLPTPPSSLIQPRATPRPLVVGPLPFEGVKISELKFAEENAVDPNDEWEYGNRFARQDVHFIQCVFIYEYPEVKQKVAFQLEFILYKDGENYTTCKTDVIIEPPSTGHGAACGSGSENPGSFPPGMYYVEALLEGKVIGNGVFEIYE